jgi:ferredoxin
MSTPEGRFGGHSPDCNAGLCLNQRHRGAGCRRCVDGCPTGAIRLEGSRPLLDESLCVQCGGCLVICPTDVFSQISPPEPTLAQTLAYLPPDAPLALVCPRHSSPRQSRAPVEAVVRHARCLAALSLPLLLELSRQSQRTLWLDDSPCADCSFVLCHTLLAESVAGTNTLLAACGHSPALRLTTLHGQDVPPAGVERPLLDGMRPQLSRRGFFASLRQMGEERMERALREEPSPMLRPGVEIEKRLPQRLPESRRQLLAWLAVLGPSSAIDPQVQVSLDNLPFAAVEVDSESCSACGLCARFCPTGALQFEGPGVGALRSDEQQSYALFFHPRLCLDCDICQAACPEKAVILGDSLTPPALFEEHYACLVAGDLTGCISCGVAVADHIQPARCFACRPQMAFTDHTPRPTASLPARKQTGRGC